MSLGPYYFWAIQDSKDLAGYPSSRMGREIRAEKYFELRRENMFLAEHVSPTATIGKVKGPHHAWCGPTS